MRPPLALLAVAFACGIWLAEELAVPLAAAGAIALASAVLLGCAWRARRLGGVAALLASAAVGGLAAREAWPRAPGGLTDGAPWQATARVVAAPERAFGRSHVLVGLEEVARAGVAREAPGSVWLDLGGDPAEPLLPGDRVRFAARLHRPQGFAEPDSPDPARRLAERGAVAVGGLAEPAALARLDGDEEDGVARRVAAWRARLLARVRSRLQGDRAALVASLVLGDRAGISAELDDAFRVAGVSHVLSVSGLHLAIAGFLALVVLRRLLGRVTPLARRVAVGRIAAAAALPVTALYTALTGAAAATLRSCAVAWVWLGGALSGRPASAQAALGAAALALLAASPLSLFDPSLQLSFAAAIGGAALAPRWIERLAPVPRTWPRRIARFAVVLAVASAAAIAATAPIAAYHFGQVAPVGLLANLVVVPLAETWVLPVGLAACVAAALPHGGGLADRLLDLAGLGAAAMGAATRWFASWAPRGRVPSPTVVEAIAWWALVCSLGRPRWRKILAVALLSLAACASVRLLAPRLSPSLRVTFLDVGQGDACLVELPDGRSLLVDGGGSFDPRFDPGEQLIAPWLERHGVRRLAAVVLTHPHPDHANGLAAIVERFPVGEVWDNGAPSSLPGLERLEAAARAHGVPVIRPHPLDGGGAHLAVLHPLDTGGAVRVDPRWSENDGSIVLRIEWAGRAVLLAGDIEARAEAKLVAAGAPLEADVLKAPHHGSRTSSTAPFVAAVRPELVVFSVGAGNRFGFPAPEVDARWRAAAARTLRTDRDGAVSVAIDRRGRIDVATAR